MEITIDFKNGNVFYNGHIEEMVFRNGQIELSFYENSKWQTVRFSMDQIVEFKAEEL